MVGRPARIRPGDFSHLDRPPPRWRGAVRVHRPGKDSREGEALHQDASHAGIRNCQGTKSKRDFHYGPTETSGVGSGTATWALSYRGDETSPDGGVVVFRKGSNFGFIQVSGTWGPADQTMESVAKEAVSRLAE